ncbi:hypothetical protein [Nocardia asiatica]|uniref:hypothetical protein n=1 Tax=Nocardia asiatica TaxID=209252 RepID=UPI0006887768|nr:hypothetical protein [Nocardia asiatica]
MLNTILPRDAGDAHPVAEIASSVGTHGTPPLALDVDDHFLDRMAVHMQDKIFVDIHGEFSSNDPRRSKVSRRSDSPLADRVLIDPVPNSGTRHIAQPRITV